MSKSTLESLEQVIKKFLLPVEEKNYQVLCELKKLEDKIVKIERDKSECKSCRAKSAINSANDFKPKSTQIAPNQAKNTLQERAAKLQPIKARAQSVSAARAGGRRGSLPAAPSQLTDTTAQNITRLAPLRKQERAQISNDEADAHAPIFIP
ncbi:hypothetical protein O0L34_g19478 [Tuta absoluta]|nr:hypothetical protein O0L34_g19478 [Tuta absoluta]